MSRPRACGRLSRLLQQPQEQLKGTPGEPTLRGACEIAAAHLHVAFSAAKAGRRGTAANPQHMIERVTEAVIQRALELEEQGFA
jgi:hypothetical protein